MLTLHEFCTCTKTYQRYKEFINPFPSSDGSVEAIALLMRYVLEPVIERYSEEKFTLTYGFCSKDLKRYLERDPATGKRNGMICPSVDQHMAHEKNSKGNYFCRRLGAACDFKIEGVNGLEVIQFLRTETPFDSCYFYGTDRPVHVSLGPQHKRVAYDMTNRVPKLLK